jgi:hypothetical protein
VNRLGGALKTLKFKWWQCVSGALESFVAAMSINPPVLGMLEGLASPLEAFRVTWPASTVHGRNEVFLAYRPGMKVDIKRPNEGTTALHWCCAIQKKLQWFRCRDFSQSETVPCIHEQSTLSLRRYTSHRL